MENEKQSDIENVAWTMPKDSEIGKVNFDIEKYNNEPLPLESVNEVDEKLTWKDFDQDPSGQFIYVYRGMSGDKKSVEDSAHQTRISEESKELINDKYKTTDPRKIAQYDTMITSYNSATLHTTRNKDLAGQFSRSGEFTGVVVTYKIPKNWVLKNKEKIILGNMGEEEVDFVFGLPKNFVDNIDQHGENLESITINENQKDQSLQNNLIDNKDLPPRPPTNDNFLP